MQTCVILNCKVKNHLIEDAKVIVDYDLYDGEVDVGDRGPMIELICVRNMKGRLLYHITRALSERDIDYLVDQVFDDMP